MSKVYHLFGGDQPWNTKDWTASDDRVRGGQSQSYLDCHQQAAEFHGTLDINSLGGAGFASQRTTAEDREWDLCSYAGITLDLIKGDHKRYTFILKDELLPRDPDTGREQATISYEYDFYFADAEDATSGCRSLFIPFQSFKPTYRGKEKKDADPIDLKHVRRISIMNRSFFGDQEGKFSLSIGSIKATLSPSNAAKSVGSDQGSIVKPPHTPSRSPMDRLRIWLTGCFSPDS